MCEDAASVQGATERPGTGDTVLVTRVLRDGTTHRFRGVLDVSLPPGGFSVVGEDLGSGLRTRGYFMSEDDSMGTRQSVERVQGSLS